MFLYREVLGVQLPWLDEIVQARAGRRLPVVLTPREVKALLGALHGAHWLVASLLYGTGIGLLENLRLRVKDIEFERREIVVREGKGNKDRVTVLPETLILPLRDQIANAELTHERDVNAGYGDVEMPHALDSSTRVQGGGGVGSTFFLRPGDRSIRGVASFDDIASSSRTSSARSTCGATGRDRQA